MKTYGAEIEWGDIDRTKQLPDGCSWDLKERTIMNSNGVAVDGTGKHWKFGGEIHPRHTDAGDSEPLLLLRDRFYELYALFPEARLTHRNGVHYHIAIPGLAEDLNALKSLQRYIHSHLKPVISILEPIASNEDDFSDPEQKKLARWHYQRMLRSHQNFVPDSLLEKQLSATTVKEFFDWECPQEIRDGNSVAMHHLRPRACVNLRQIMQTGTIEFRHFFSTLNADEFLAGLTWCDNFVKHWENNSPVELLASEAALFAPLIPKQQPAFCPTNEIRFRDTAWDGAIDRSLALSNALFIQNKFPLPQKPIEYPARPKLI